MCWSVNLDQLVRFALTALELLNCTSPYFKKFCWSPILPVKGKNKDLVYCSVYSETSLGRGKGQAEYVRENEVSHIEILFHILYYRASLWVPADVDFAARFPLHCKSSVFFERNRRIWDWCQEFFLRCNATNELSATTTTTETRNWAKQKLWTFSTLFVRFVWHHCRTNVVKPSWNSNAIVREAYFRNLSELFPFLFFIYVVMFPPYQNIFVE